MSLPSPSEPESFLDQQLDNLMLRLCRQCGHEPDADQRQDLARLLQRVNQATLAGRIALPLSASGLENGIEKLQPLPVLGGPEDYTPLVLEHGHVWFRRYWQYEQRLACNLNQRLRPVTLPPSVQTAIDTRLAQWFADPDAALQRQAVTLAMQQHFSIISGGPGTGKTTTVVRLLALLLEVLQLTPERILLAAPTGKAAMRLQESIRHARSSLGLPEAILGRLPDQAGTLHRLLGYRPGSNRFRHGPQHPLPAQVVIVDEASMIDIALMTHLFEAVPDPARLILLGDRDQLASVETGSVFRDLCRYSDAPDHALHAHVTLLQKSWRFRSDSGIGQLAQAVRDGDERQLEQVLAQNWPDLGLQPTIHLEAGQLRSAWQDYLKALQANPPDLAQIFNAFNDFRILTPLRQGNSGSERLNQYINRTLRQHLSQGQRRQPDPEWFHGRPILITRNDYRLQLFNGDLGLCLQQPDGSFRVWFQGNDAGGPQWRSLAPVRLPAHESAWVMTIHKSQGSEFGQVLLILPEENDNPILGRELLYTGITRARNRLDIMGGMETLKPALQRTLGPVSCLGWRLAQVEGH
ncbi:MAG TPA: exodeoxyribonuclease V subunit alpha [Thiolinea sp.]|nr:exodeoxyribonuclease V subunit alpha [Thiolinea sp.]